MPVSADSQVSWFGIQAEIAGEGLEVIAGASV